MPKLLLGVVFVAGLFAAGCGDVDVPKHPDPLDHRDDETAGMKELRLQASDVKFLPEMLSIKAGDTVKLTLENEDAAEHDFQIDDIDAEILDGGVEAGELGGGHDTAALAIHTKANETASVTFVANEPGTYEYYCTISGHKESGMVGTLTVE